LAYEAAGVPVENIEVRYAGSSANSMTPLFIIGAHYDSAFDAPGANDNGTGTAALLELARLLTAIKLKNVELRLVFFTNEEPPHFMSTSMGSAVYASALHAERRHVRGMLSLECLGVYYDQPGTQSYPSPFDKVFENKGNFVSFVGSTAARRLVHDAISSFLTHTKFPSIGGVAPRYIRGIDWSDHAPFDDLGWPAIMITDTAVFRYQHYHQTTDTPDKVDNEKLARITKGIERVIRDLVKK
jgi:Zn-dependent M28 family amino/carboxypeptidase